MDLNTAAALCQRYTEGAQVLSVTRLTGGVSADVFRLDLDAAAGTPQRVVLRVHGANHNGHAARLEYDLLLALHRLGLPVPEPLLVDDSGSLLAEPYLLQAFVDGSTEIPAHAAAQHMHAMADMLARIHATPTAALPALPPRLDPLPEVFDFLPEGDEWNGLRRSLEDLAGTAYTGTPKLLHGDFWPENLLWREGALCGVLDWEDAALGDPLSDVAACRLELRYRFGRSGMRIFTDAYAMHQPLDLQRLAVWQVYVAAAAHKYMGEWRLEPEREAHMRREALACVREAAAAIGQGASL